MLVRDDQDLKEFMDTYGLTEVPETASEPAADMGDVLPAEDDAQSTEETNEADPAEEVSAGPEEAASRAG